MTRTYDDPLTVWGLFWWCVAGVLGTASIIFLGVFIVLAVAS